MQTRLKLTYSTRRMTKKRMARADEPHRRKTPSDSPLVTKLTSLKQQRGGGGQRRTKQTGWLTRSGIFAAICSGVGVQAESHSTLDQLAYDHERTLTSKQGETSEGHAYFDTSKESLLTGDKISWSNYDPDYWTFETQCEAEAAYSNNSSNQIIFEAFGDENSIKFKYEWASDVTVATVFLLFDTSMMS